MVVLSRRIESDQSDELKHRQKQTFTETTTCYVRYSSGTKWVGKLMYERHDLAGQHQAVQYF